MKKQFLTALRIKRGKIGAKLPLKIGRTVIVTFSGLNYRKTPDLAMNADFCKDSKSGLGSKIGPTQPEIESMH